MKRANLTRTELTRVADEFRSERDAAKRDTGRMQDERDIALNQLALAEKQRDEALTFIAWIAAIVMGPHYDDPLERMGIAEDCKAFADGRMNRRWLDIDWQVERTIALTDLINEYLSEYTVSSEWQKRFDAALKNERREEPQPEATEDQTRI